jgi:hypothetical protein
MAKKVKKTTQFKGLDVEMEGGIREGKVHYHLTAKKEYGQLGVTLGLELSIPEGMTPSEALDGTKDILLAELDRSGGTTIGRISDFIDAQKRRR